MCQRILALDPLLAYSVSVTTRPPRPGETNRQHYEFVGDEKFDALTREGALAEWAVVHGHRYGTRRSVIDELLAAGRDVVMDLDVQGGESMRRAYPESLLIFILPPSREALEARLRGRATDHDEVIATRLRNAGDELSCATRYDRCIVNEDLDRAVAEVLHVVESVRDKRSM